MTPEEFFDHLWQDYISIAPAAKVLHDAVAARGETVVNDHVAFRTFDRSPVNLDSLEKHILALGYERFAPYHFEDKKLRANGYLHPKGFPRVFLSELETDKFSPALRGAVDALCAQVDPARVEDPSILWSGRPWAALPYGIYESLLAESEYAGWVSALGLRANHFTISVNHLKTMSTLDELLDFVEEQGHPLNTSGGRIKGSPGVLLEQASTLADKAEVEFANGVRRTIPTCYYEFARRYKDPEGKLYEGFVAASADKIFESTNTR